MKILTKVIRDIEVRRVMRVPPRNSQLPRSANIAAIEKQTNTNVLPIRAVTIIDGSTKLTYSRSGPKLIPEKGIMFKLFILKLFITYY